MKVRTSAKILWPILSAACLVAINLWAQAPPSTVPAASTAGVAAVKLPYGVNDVLKLSRAQVGEEIIVSYIHNTGTIYNLTPKDIVYLKQQGVADRIVNTMLEQRQRVTDFAAQTSPPAAS